MPLFKARGPAREVNRTGRVATGAVAILKRAADVSLAVRAVQQRPTVRVEIFGCIVRGAGREG